jgi:uncharacterized membrane protein
MRELIGPIPPAVPTNPNGAKRTLLASGRRASNLLPFAIGWLAARLEELLAWLRAQVNGRPRVETIHSRRWWEIDAFRGVAIGMMLVHHMSMSWLAVFNKPASQAMILAWPWLKLWAILPIAAFIVYQAAFATPAFDFSTSGKAGLALFLGEVAFLTWSVLWISSAGSGATAFMFLMGLSMAISFWRAQQKPGGARFEQWLRRGVSIFALGMVITLLSFIFVPQTPTLFGVLHMLGVSTILAYPFLQLPAWATALSGAGVIGANTILQTVAPGGLGLWLGPTSPISMLDYAPLIPWFGAVLLGLAAGKLYLQGRDSGKFTPPDLSHTRLGKVFAWMGQNSLTVYMAQAPFFWAGMGLL